MPPPETPPAPQRPESPGAGSPERWPNLLTAVPREFFAPNIALVGPVLEDAASWIDRERDPDEWWRAVHSDTAIGTQLNDGTIDLAAKTNVDPAAVATSSSSAPSLVAAMLDLLNADAGHRVLEIGTGTGWTVPGADQR